VLVVGGWVFVPQQMAVPPPLVGNQSGELVDGSKASRRISKQPPRPPSPPSSAKGQRRPGGDEEDGGLPVP